MTTNGSPDRDRVSAEPRPEPTEAVLEHLAHCDHLLVATDFDGVLAPIVDDPEQSVPLPVAVEALASLAETASTSVAIVSGRERRQLRQMVPGADRFVLVGSHGAELDELDSDEAKQRQLGQLVSQLDQLQKQVPGLFVETKRYSVAAHLRRVADENRPQAQAALAELVDQWEHDSNHEANERQPETNGKVVSGKEVIEFTTTSANKGDAIRALSQRVSASTTLYLGDDVTDEDAFEALGPSDIGIKVGPGPTLATNGLASPEVVATFLQTLASRRVNRFG